MTVDEFETQRGTLPCVYDTCKSTDLATRPRNQNIELYCITCGRYQRYLGKGKRPARRPPDGISVDEVWEGSKGHCAHCGLHESTLEILGIGRTKQHVPPFVVNGHEGTYQIPLCDWCQQNSASQMRRLKCMVDRLSKKKDMWGMDE